MFDQNEKVLLGHINKDSSTGNKLKTYATLKNSFEWKITYSAVQMYKNEEILHN